MTSRMYLLWQMTRASFLAEEKNSALGFLWHLLNPLAMTAVLYLTFSSVAAPAVEHYPLFILVGVIHFNFFSNATVRAAEGMLRNRSLILNTTVPLELLVLRGVCVEALTLALEIALVGVLVQLAGDGLGLAALGYGLALGGLLLLTFGVALLLAAVVIFMRDILYVWSIASRMLFFLTPIFYSAEAVHSRPLEVAVAINPLAALIDTARESLLYGHAPPFWGACVGLLGPLAVGVVGWRTFQRCKKRIPDYA